MNVEKNIDTLFKLLTKYKVEIPIVQRDYAQGRNDSHSKSVRETLLQDIRAAVDGGGTLDLNFIYGKIDECKFIPLDGQQRLTTLFLIHLYAFASDESGSELLNKFTYETRASSREFLKKLVEHRSSVFSSKSDPSEEISDSDWYQPDWDNDPTVQSVKNVLDDIARIMGGLQDLREKLTNNDNKPVRFSFLPMDELGMEDSIYIKMNARGRMLTPFENYKAQLISRVRWLWDNEKLIIEPRDFERCMDGNWTDLFWSNRRNDFDTAFKKFFDVMFTNFANLPENSGYVSSVEIKDVTAQMVEAAYHTLNYLCTADSKANAWQMIFDCLGWPSYTQRLLFFAVSEYMLQAKGYVQQSLDQWVRIICNIINNTNEQTIGRAENFGPAIQAIAALSTYWNKLLEYFAEESVSLKIFSPVQIDEERIKAKLILRSSDFRDKILSAEKHGYFGGQLRSALTLAGITYDVAKEEEDTLLKEKMLIFDSYWCKISALFSDKEPIFGTLTRQALLVNQDYTLRTGSYHSFGVDNPNDPVSLKALFADATKIDLIRTLLDSFSSTQPDDIKHSLQKLINDANIPENDWRYCFVKYPRLFGFMSRQYMRIYKGWKILIIKNMAANGYNREVFTYTLRVILNSKNITFEPVDELGSYGDHYVVINAHGTRVNIRFKENKFVVYDAELDKNKPESTLFQTQGEPLSEILAYIENNL
jgi:hypothetical protein